MTAILPEQRIDSRQVLAAGRFSEEITERPIEGFAAALTYAHAGGSGQFPAQFTAQPGGYFALHISPGRQMPDLSGAGAVTLTLTLSRPGETDLVLDEGTTGAELAVVDQAQTVFGQVVAAPVVSGAPFRFTATIPPQAVLLDGIVILDNDPDAPATGISVTAAPAPPVVSDAEGRFRIPALPIAETVTITFDDGVTQTDRPIQPDYSRTTMAASFSIPSP